MKLLKIALLIPLIFIFSNISAIGSQYIEPCDSLFYKFSPAQVRKLNMIIQENQFLRNEINSYLISDSLLNDKVNSSELQLKNCQEINNLKELQIKKLESIPAATVIQNNRKWYEPPLYSLLGVAAGIIISVIFIK